MNLVIDIGNTSSKVAIFDGDELLKHQNCSLLTLQEILLFTKDYIISATIISSVKELNDEIESIRSHFNALLLSHNTPIPISNNYQSPETLGKDRLAAIVGASKEFPNKNILVIDAGTCITFDYFLEGIYCGGRISPGLQMRYDALHQFTNQLPQINFSDEHFSLGNDTKSSIITGVQQGILDEIDGGITAFVKENKNTIVIVCGGYYKFFVKHLKNSIFANPFIVLKGLNIISEFNAKK